MAISNVAKIKPIVSQDDWAGVALLPRFSDATATPVLSPITAASASVVVPGGAVRVTFLASGAGATVSVNNQDGVVGLPSGVPIVFDCAGMSDAAGLFPTQFDVTKNSATNVGFWFDMLEA